MPSVLAELVALPAPPACAACRRPLASADARVCPGCLARIPWLRGPCCPRCALPAPRGAPCAARGAPYARAWSPVAYEGVARDLIWALKFEGGLGLADLLGAQIAANLPRALRRVPVVPVPAHPARRRRRGYDPAGVLAAAVARR